MTPEEKRLLEETHALSEENNRILKKIRRASLVSTIVRLSYWVIIIGLSFGAYYFIQPYIEQLGIVYDGAQKNVSEVQTVTNGFSNFLKNFSQ